MRDYISPTQFTMWYDCPIKWYIGYVLDRRLFKQTMPMAVGSAFDAFVKVKVLSLFGRQIDGNKLLEQQVQIKGEMRDVAIAEGFRVFQLYCQSGVLERLARELDENVDVTGELKKDIGGVTVLGLPDCSTKWLVLDWKVTGYGKGRTVSPEGGATWVSREHARRVKPRTAVAHGVTINSETIAPDKGKWIYWYPQVVIYSMLLDVPLAGIDQVCYRGDGSVNVACHRYRISPEEKEHIRERLVNMQAHINKGHYLHDLSFEQSIELCAELRDDTTLQDWYLAL